MSILFDEIIFGPIQSRRLGTSLGVNVLPTTHKICNFNCVYCECGWNKPDTIISHDSRKKLHPRADIKEALNNKLEILKEKGILLNSITFAGNGEPTIHPDFAEIVSDTIELRDKYYPNAKTSVLTNSAYLSNSAVFDALLKIDNPILKLDAGSKEMFENINQVNSSSSDFEAILQKLIEFGNRGIIQTLLLRGKHNDTIIDNTSEKEFGLYLEHLRKINPKYVMLYAIDRETPEHNLEKLSLEELESFADKIRAIGIDVKVFG